MSSAPTTRSRTLLFLSYRDSRASSSTSHHRYALDNDGDENERLIDPTKDHITIDVGLPPKWVDISDKIEAVLADTQLKINALDKLQAKHALPGFTDRTAEEREIEAVTAEITSSFHHCHRLIQQIGSDSVHSFPPSQHHRHSAANNVQRGLAAKLQGLSASFRKKQRVYLERLQGHAIKNQDLLIASGSLSLKGQEGLSAVDDDLQAASQLQVQDNLQPDLRQRDRELTEIAKSIADLAVLFKDLSSMVIDQGTLLDSVEYNIEQTAVQVSQAVKELDVATRYQKNTGRRSCIFLLLLIIFGLIIVLIFKPRRPSSTATPQPPLSADGLGDALDQRWTFRRTIPV
ncbi:t-SNARE [Thelephora ganbajun]|uniref:t-SNARE n=1 Tax=Thelephora ganbajun TaxID=370292 RepID=A0ACB6ZWN3_THEGA|nr:t-SNARE [Thelephora ganbajun]